uniref:Protein Flattop n=1 Tax=Oreochromis niloticus TaxID=8128 RepID=A0A669CCR3_ORENI
MSSSYSANQYDSAFKPHRLQNWCETKHFRERPSALVGHTTFIADNRGHLLPGVGKRGLAWPDFKGTWDLPARIPGQRINPTTRSVEGLNRVKSWGLYPKNADMSQPHRGSKSTNRQKETAEQVRATQTQHSLVSSVYVECILTVFPSRLMFSQTLCCLHSVFVSHVTYPLKLLRLSK